MRIHSCVVLQRDIATPLMRYESNDNVSYENVNRNTNGIKKKGHINGKHKS